MQPRLARVLLVTSWTQTPTRARRVTSVRRWARSGDRFPPGPGRPRPPASSWWTAGRQAAPPVWLRGARPGIHTGKPSSPQTGRAWAGPCSPWLRLCGQTPGFGEKHPTAGSPCLGDTAPAQHSFCGDYFPHELLPAPQQHQSPLMWPQAETNKAAWDRQNLGHRVGFPTFRGPPVDRAVGRGVSGCSFRVPHSEGLTGGPFHTDAPQAP